MSADWYGYLATILNVFMLLPQVARTLKTKQVNGLSMATPTVFFIASALWIAYGIDTHAAPIVIANSSACAMNLVLIIAKVRYK